MQSKLTHQKHTRIVQASVIKKNIAQSKTNTPAAYARKEIIPTPRTETFPEYHKRKLRDKPNNTPEWRNHQQESKYTNEANPTTPAKCTARTETSQNQQTPRTT